MLHDLHHLRLAFATKSDERKKRLLRMLWLICLSFTVGEHNSPVQIFFFKTLQLNRNYSSIRMSIKRKPNNIRKSSDVGELYTC